jgi:hypothetical protein
MTILVLLVFLGGALTILSPSGTVGAHVFSIEFLDDGVRAYAFTFG